LSAATYEQVLVNLQFSGTAKRAEDYIVQAEQLLIEPGQTAAFVTLQSLPDTFDESSESIIIEVVAVNGGGVSIGRSHRATIEIVDSIPIASMEGWLQLLLDVQEEDGKKQDEQRHEFD
jgi:hypothetical protein